MTAFEGLLEATRCRPPYVNLRRKSTSVAEDLTQDYWVSLAVGIHWQRERHLIISPRDQRVKWYPVRPKGSS